MKIVAAALTLKEEGEISRPVVTQRGFVILRLDRRTQSEHLSLNAVHAQIQQHLLAEVRARKIKESTAAVVARHTTKLFEDAIH